MERSDAMDGIRIELSGGRAVTVDIESLKAALKEMYESVVRPDVARLVSFARSVKRDTSFAARSLSARGAGGVESNTLSGARREQFAALCECMRRTPETPLVEAARRAILAAPSASGGYASAESLAKYAARHRSWWEGGENAK